ncbi:MAG: type II secretion system F family protein [Proteobacteria bacterium]|nr:type II secretion system F family protein [Pseudomonadota bacterium]
MNTFRYKGIDSKGRINAGRMDAVNVADLEMRLQKMDLDLVNCKDLGVTGLKASAGGVKRRDLITLCFHLEQTAKAGVPILESLADLRDSSDNPRLREVLSAMYEAIEGGQTLSQAMSTYPSVFSEVFTALVEAGEESGEIGTVFFELGENLKWQDEQAAMTKKLLMYPLFVGTVVTGVIFFLMIYLVPELLSFIRNMGQEIPVHTKVLIYVSNTFVHYWYLIIGIPTIFVVALSIGIKVSPRIHYQVDAFKLKIPLVGPILRKIMLARLAGFFAIMYASGITIVDCIKTGEKIVGNKAMEAAVHHVGVQIADGVTLSNSFESAKLFPPLVLRMIRVGESTGALEVALQNINYFYTRDVKESIERLQTMIEPGMTVILGSIIAWVMFSVLGPIYDLITKIKI